MLNKLFEKYVHSSIDMIVDGIVDGKQGQKLKTVVPQTDLNMVGLSQMCSSVCIKIVPFPDYLDSFCMSWWCVQVTQLCLMLDALLDTESYSAEVLECYFLEALYCSLGATLLDSGKIKFDEFIKKLSCLNTVHDEKALAGPGEIPGKINK